MYEEYLAEFRDKVRKAATFFGAAEDAGVVVYTRLGNDYLSLDFNGADGIHRTVELYEGGKAYIKHELKEEQK